MSRDILFSVLLSALACAVHAGTNVVTTCAQLAHIAKSGDANQHLFDVTAQITFTDTQGSGYLGLQDKTGAVLALPTTSSVKRGDFVHVKGCTKSHFETSSGIYCWTIDILSHSRPIAPTKVSATEIANGEADFRLITLRGVVRDAFKDDIDGAFIGLSLLSDGLIFYVTVSSENSEAALTAAKDLIGTEVTITGICEPRPHPNRKYVGRSILICSLNNDTQATNTNKTHIALPSIDNLIFANPETIAKQGHHQACGTVLARWGTNKIILRNTNDKIVLTKLKTDMLPSVGQAITVVGFPETDLYHINLAQAEWKPATIPQTSVQTLTNVSANAIYRQGVHGSISPDYHGQLVRIKGIVRHFPNPSEPFEYLCIESDGYLIPIYSDQDTLKGISIGCMIEATGICVLDIPNWSPNNPLPRITGFFVVTRSPEDIVVVARPSWWTPARLMAVIGGLVALIVVILVWNVSLRVLAERRGRALFKARIGNATAKLKVEERTHLAIELHDTIAQNLTGVSMELESTSDLSEDASPEMRHHLNIAMKALKSCREELRHCLFDLRNQALEEPSFKIAIEKTLQPHLNGAKLAVRFNVPRKELHDNTAQALLRAIRELAINAVRHGKATSIKIAGELDADGLRCSVRDDGCGFDPDTCPGVLQGHFGLQGVRERIEGLGGTFAITSAPGKGSKAVITIHSPKVTDEENS